MERILLPMDPESDISRRKFLMANSFCIVHENVLYTRGRINNNQLVRIANGHNPALYYGFMVIIVIITNGKPLALDFSPAFFNKSCYLEKDLPVFCGAIARSRICTEVTNLDLSSYKVFNWHLTCHSPLLP